jgi:FkbM family methyltransferase
MVENLIFDLGMCNGDDTAYYLHKGYRVVAVDANPAMIENARHRFADEIASGKLVLEYGAIAESRGEAEFWINLEWPEWSSMHRQFSSRLDHPLERVVVPRLPPEDLFAHYGVPYYLKIDIEGNDVLCLKALKCGDLPAFCSWEAGGLEPLFLARELGFDVFRCVDQETLGPLGLPLPKETALAQWWGHLYKSHLFSLRVARKLIGRAFLLRHWQKLRKDGPWSFPMGSTGAFGSFLPGRWESVESCAAAWLNAYLPHERDPQRRSYPWTDFHAGRAECLDSSRRPAGVGLPNESFAQ